MIVKAKYEDVGASNSVGDPSDLNLPEVMAAEVSARSDELFEKSRQAIYRHTDRLFAWLMGAQWIAGIIAALVIAPRTWIGATSQVHLHVWAAIIVGALISSCPIALALLRPGKRSTRYVVAIGQMLWSSLLIHLTGGRIETHFHVFGSLAFLAFYRDWTVLIPATIVVAVDHFIRGVYYPQSVFGIMVTSQWRWIEHAAWVIFEDSFLVASCVRSVREMRSIADRASQLFSLNTRIESVVKNRTKALQASEERFRSISAASPIGIFQTDAEGNSIYTNERWQEISGLTFEESLGQGWATAIHDADRAEIMREWQISVSRGEGILWECRVVTPQKVLRWISIRSRPMRSEQGIIIGHVGSVEDITEQRAAADQLKRGAYHDALTGLPNRAALLEALDRALAHQRRRVSYAFAVLFLDLDRFKNVNDSLGHRMGDRLLVAVTERLQACLRPGDMMARHGGDEFTMLLDDVSEAFEATVVAERVEKALSTPFDLEGHAVFVGCSIGITVSTIGYQTGDEMMRDADIAMYRAKSAGRGRFETFDRAMHERAVQRLQLETDLRYAVEREELFLLYQPIVALSSGEVTGFEALLRWNHPQRGIISPTEFIPISEETGLILSIGQFVLRKACEWLAVLNRTRPHGKELMVSANLSGNQLSVPNLASEIESILKETKLAPQWLKLEITESTIMENSDRAAVVLQRLREIGIALLVDDFGTGYSSLAYLHRFPLNTLKIDRTFVSGEAAGGDQIIRAIVALAQNLGMEVIAEGIESAAQAERLTALGCQFGQGYYFSIPLTPSEVIALLETADSRSAKNIAAILPTDSGETLAAGALA